MMLCPIVQPVEEECEVETGDWWKHKVLNPRSS